jgi:hypothetical protein
MNARPYEFPDLSWHRRVWSAGWCVLAGFIIAVFLVTGLFYMLDPYHGDGRDPFIKEVKQAQELNQLKNL